MLTDWLRGLMVHMVAGHMVGDRGDRCGVRHVVQVMNESGTVGDRVRHRMVVRTGRTVRAVVRQIIAAVRHVAVVQQTGVHVSRVQFAHLLLRILDSHAATITAEQHVILKTVHGVCGQPNILWRDRKEINYN